MFVSKFIYHFKWVDNNCIQLRTPLGKLIRLLDKAITTKDDININPTIKSVKKLDEGFAMYYFLPEFQKGANTMNQSKIKPWKTISCDHFNDRGCANSDTCKFFHDGYDWRRPKDNVVFASHLAMRMNLECAGCPPNVWDKITKSFTKVYSHAEQSRYGRSCPTMQIRDMYVGLTDAQALARTEDTFVSTPPIVSLDEQHASTPNKDWGSWDSTPAKDDKQWHSDSRHVAKGQKVDHSGSSWDADRKPSWKSDTWDKEGWRKKEVPEWKRGPNPDPDKYEWHSFSEHAGGYHPKVEPTDKGDHWTKPAWEKDIPQPRQGNSYWERNSEHPGAASSNSESEQQLLARQQLLIEQLKAQKELAEITEKLSEMRS